MAQYRITEIEDYESLVGTETIQRIRQKPARIGKACASRISILRATPAVWPRRFLRSLYSWTALGLHTGGEWSNAHPIFFPIIKKMHHALQGGETEMGREVRETVREIFVDALPRTTSPSFRPAV